MFMITLNFAETLPNYQPEMILQHIMATSIRLMLVVAIVVFSTIYMGKNLRHAVAILIRLLQKYVVPTRTMEFRVVIGTYT
nr:MAG TPA: hypothetical protein [Caudoviricetes sp.]